MVLPQPARGILLAAIVLLALWPASARGEDPFCAEREQANQQAGLPEPLCRDPDLVPTGMGYQATDERFPSKMCGNALNVGSDSQTKSFFFVLLTVDGLDATVQQVRSLLSTGQASEDLCWNATLASGWHRYHLTVDVPRGDAPQGDVAEAREDDNVARDQWFYVRPAPQPNLRLSDFVVSPTVGRPGTDQFMVATVLNAGAASSSPTALEYRDDHGFIARFAVPSLAAGAHTQIVQYNLTDARPAGTFTAKAVLDPDNATVLDCSNTNYVLCKEYTILEHPAPDLNFTNVTVHGAFVANRGLLVDAIVKNIGDRIAGPATIRAYDGARPVANATRPSLSPGQTLRVQFYVVLGPGNHTLRIASDPDNITVERNETNNDWFVPIDIAGDAVDTRRPNLFVERMDALPDDPTPGERVMVNVLVRNLGEVASNATTLRVEADGVVISNVSLGIIPSHASASPTIFWGGALGGDHVLRAIVDPAGTLNETTKDDNELQIAFLIRPPAEATPPEPTPTPPTDVVPPTPTTPTPTTPTPDGAPTVTVASFDVVTKDAGGSLKGYLGVVVRNPNLAPLSRISVEFYVDGKLVGDKIIPAVPGAGSGAQRSDDVDLSPGHHVVSADLRIIGTDSAPIHVEKAYEAAAPNKTPMPGAPVILGLFVAIGILLGRRHSR